MNFDMLIMTTIFIGTIAGLVMYPARAVVVFGVSMLLTFLSGIVNEGELIHSITNQGVLSLILLLLASVAVEKTSIIRWISARIDSPSFSWSWLKLYVSTAFSSALLNNTAVVATMLSPIRNNKNQPAAKLLIPLSYAAILGGTLTLIGTSTNLIINSMLLETGHHGFSFFSFTAIGIIVTLSCAGVVYFISRRIKSTLTLDEDVDSYLLNAKVLSDSPLIGKKVHEANLRHLESLFLVEIVRDGRAITPVGPEHVIQESDRLVFSGDVKHFAQLQQFAGLEIMPEAEQLDHSLMTEVVLKQNSSLVGKTLKQCNFRSTFNAAVVAVKRDGEPLKGKLGDVKLNVGDFLVLATGKDFKKRNNIKKNFIFVSGVEPNHKLVGKAQLVPVLGFLAAVTAAALGVVSLLKALIILMAVNLITKSIQLQEVRQRFPFEIWMIVSSALVLAHGIENTGLVNHLISAVDFSLTKDNAFMFAVIVFFATLAVTELVTNNASAALLFPFAYSVPVVFGLDPIPFILALVFGANASFISPFGYQTNLMVFNAGQYKLKQFISAGLPVSLVYSVTVLICLKMMYF